MTGRKNKQYISQKSNGKVSRQAMFFTKRYAEMEYTNHPDKIQPLARGKYEGYPFVVISYGSHPALYICLPKDHPLSGKHYSEDARMEELQGHWSVTYSGSTAPTSTITDRWWLGWDYAHFGDYLPYLPDILKKDSKMWTREEIVDEAKRVIKQLKAMEDQNG